MHLSDMVNPLEYPTRLESKNKVSYDRLVIAYHKAVHAGNKTWASKVLHRLRQCPLPYNCWTYEDRQIELAKVAAKKAGVEYTGPEPSFIATQAALPAVPQYTPQYTPQYAVPQTVPKAAGFGGWVPLALAAAGIWFFMYRK